MKRLVAAELRNRRRGLLALGAAVFAFVLLLAGSYQALGGPNTTGFLSPKNTPSFVRALSGSQTTDIMQPKHYVGFGFNHPLFLVLTLAVVISIAAGGIAGDVESGRAQLFYSRPIRRSRLVLVRVATMALAELAALVASLVAVAIGTQLAPDLGGTLPAAAAVLAQYAGLAAVVGGAAFLASSMTRTRSAATGTAVAFTAGMYLLDFVSLLVDRARALRWLTPFGYYDPLTAAARGVNAARLAVLFVAAALLVGAACVVTEHRDVV